MSVIARRVPVCLPNSLSRGAFVAAVIAATTTVGAGCSSADSPSASVSPQATPDSVSSRLTLDIDTKTASASGLSSGAYMAVQFHVAHSATMKGVAVFAGGPFGCAEGSPLRAITTCMASTAKLDAAPFVTTTKEKAAAGDIDDPGNLKGQRVFLFGGAKDTTVRPEVMDALRDYYDHFVEAGNVTYESRHADTGHTIPTESYGGDCPKSASPYIGKCGYDGAGAALSHIHGQLKARPQALSGKFMAIRQGDFVDAPASHSLSDTAYAYVPAACAKGERCSVHVAFHGCQQSVSAIGDGFYKHAGYNEWADTNHIVVLYPQTIKTQMSNPNGCWDWWGYDSQAYATKSAPQMKMVKSIVDALANNTVVAVQEPDVAAVVRPQADAEPACAFATNTEHVEKGRATASLGFAFAAGSNQPLGLNNALVWTSLVRVNPGFYVVGPCVP